MHIAVLVIVIILLIVLGSRAGTIFIFEVRKGKLKVTKGSAPARLVSDFREAVRHIDRCTIKGRKSARGIQLSFSGHIDEGTAQRLKNILGLHHS